MSVVSWVKHGKIVWFIWKFSGSCGFFVIISGELVIQ